MMSTLLMAASYTIPPIVYSPWYTSTITSTAVTETPVPGSYIQKDSWLTASVTAAAVTEMPLATQYLYQPTNPWLPTNLIVVSSATESPTPTQYWTYT